MLQVLLKQPNEVIPQERIRDFAYDDDVEFPQEALRKDILRIRQAFQKAGVRATIKNHYGAGYELIISGARTHTLSLSEKQILAFRRVLDIAARSKPELVSMLRSEVLGVDSGHGDG